MSHDEIEPAIAESIATKQRLLEQCMDELKAFVDAGVHCIQGGGKILFCGNGGSSCDAAHAVGELVGWFERKDRAGYPAIALGHEIPTLTAVSNDIGFELIFARQVEALGRSGDLLIGITTSGGSANVVRAIEQAKSQGIATVALVGEAGGSAADLADVAVKVPSGRTARIQESHLLCIHLLCAAIEKACV